MNAYRPSRPQLGATLIEVLVTLVISAFGLLGLAGFVSRGTTLSIDATQRARALTLANDMANRIRNNKVNSDDYLTGSTYGGAAMSACSGLVGSADRDLCEWNNLLAGTQDAQVSGNSAFLSFRGCVVKTEAAPKTYVVTVAWGSIAPATAPTDTCGKDAFGNDELRRVVRAQVRIAELGHFIAAGTP